MHLKVDSLYKISLVLLLLFPVIILSVEINIIIILCYSLLVLLDSKNKYNKTIIPVIFPLAFILIIASFSSFFYPSKLFNIIKDFFFLAKPIFYIIIGYYFVGKIKDKAFIFKTIIYASLFLAVIHLFKVIIFLGDSEFQINLLRNFAGRGNALEIFALILMFSSQGKKLYRLKSKYIIAIKIIILCSFIFYFSRTVTVSVIILYLSIKGYLTITRKGLLYMSGFITVVIFFYAYLFSSNIQREDSGISEFLYKIKIAPSEIFMTTEIDINNHEDLWDHWRAYEAQKAFQQLEDTPFSAGLIIGKGLGSLVDLGFVAPLNREGMKYITTLHNGYAYIIYKAGILGVLFYLLFLLVNYLQVYSKGNNYRVTILNNLLSGIAIYYMFTTLIVTGIYNPRDYGGIILGAILYLRYYYNQEQSIKK